MRGAHFSSTYRPQEGTECAQNLRHSTLSKKNKVFARDILNFSHLNLALFARHPCKNIEFLILFGKGGENQLLRASFFLQAAY